MSIYPHHWRRADALRHAVSSDSAPATADLMANLYSVTLGVDAPESPKSTCDVLAFDDDQAEAFARRRFNFVDDASIDLVDLKEIGDATAHRDRTLAVLRSESIDERDARFQRWENLNADAADCKAEQDFEAHHGSNTPTNQAERDAVQGRRHR